MELLCLLPAARTENAAPFSLRMLFIWTIGLCWTFSKPVLANTVFVTSVECYASVFSPITAEGLVLSGRSGGRENTCYLRPADERSLLSVRIDSLNLFGDCSTFRICEYKLPSTTLLQNEKKNLTAFREPDDVYVLAEATCKNPESLVNRVLSTSDVGYGLMLEFQFSPSPDPSSFDVTVTAYEQAPTGTCPDRLFQCSSAKTKCISPKLACDDVDNCFDGSDETFALCSYVGSVPTVLVIIIGLSVLGVVIAAIVILCLYLRSHPMKGTPVDIPMHEIHRPNPEAARSSPVGPQSRRRGGRVGAA